MVERELAEKREIARYYHENFNRMTLVTIDLVVSCTEATIRFKSRHELITHFERLVTE